MNIASTIDHTCLKAQATRTDIQELCAQAHRHQFATVCVNPSMVQLAAECLKDSSVMVCTVVGFPLGATTPELKAYETKTVIQLGAQEVDMVINIGAAKAQDWDLVKKDIQAVIKAADGVPVKVIIEACLLNREEKIKVTEVIAEAGAQFVKTSTGFSTGGATLEDIKLLSKIAGDRLKVKASGGIKTREFAMELIEAGAHRLGASSSLDLL